MRIRTSYQVAWAVGSDAADRQMRQAGRKSWSDADYNLAVAVLHQLCGADALTITAG